MTDFWQQIPNDVLGQDSAAQKAEDWASQQRAQLADMWAQSQKNVLNSVQKLWQNNVSNVTAPAGPSGNVRTTPVPAFQPPLQQYENSGGVAGPVSQAVDTGLGALNWAQNNVANPFLGTAYGTEMEAKQALGGGQSQFVQNLPQDTLQDPLAQWRELGARWGTRQDISELPQSQQTSAQIMHTAADVFNPVYWAMGGPFVKGAEGGIEALPTAANLTMGAGQALSETPQLPGESQGVYGARQTAGDVLSLGALGAQAGHGLYGAAKNLAPAAKAVATGAGKALEAIGQAGQDLGIVPGLSIQAVRPEIWEIRDNEGNLRATATSQDEARHVVSRNPSMHAVRSVQPDETPAGYMRFYHGSPQNFAVPNPAKFSPKGLFGPGYYVTDNPEIAGSYSRILVAQQDADSISHMQKLISELPDKFGADASYYREQIANLQKNLDFSSPNMRAVDVPNDLNLLDADAPADPNLIAQIRKEVPDRRFGRMVDQLYNVKRLTGRFFGGDQPTNYEVYQLLTSSQYGSEAEANNVLSRLGYDGIKYAGGKRVPMLDDNGNPIQHTALAIFPNAMPKLRNALSGAQMGGVAVGASSMIPQQPGESDAEYQRRLNISRAVGGAAIAGSLLSRDNNLVGEGKPFYSLLERLVDSKIGGKATGSQILNTLKNAGAKPAELGWTGLEDWLKQNAGRVISKQELQDFVNQNAVQVQEVIRGAPAPTERANNLRQDLQAAEDQASKTLTSLNQKYGHSWRTTAPPEERIKLNNIQDEVDRLQQELQGEENLNTNPAKFQTYSTPGGDNYRELLLTLPTQKPATTQAFQDFNNFQREMFDKYGTHNWEPKLTPSENARWQQVRDAANEDFQHGTMGQTPGVYNSPHWDEPNVLAHIRFDERTAPDGKKTLFVQEIQSDWAQKGRQQGFAPRNPLDLGGLSAEDAFYKFADELKAKYNVPTTDSWDAIRNAATPEERARFDALNQARNIASGMSSNIPPTPFAKTEDWTKLAMKRVIAWAAQHGFDRVAWTPGQMQADRYNLSNQISDLSWTKASDNAYEIVAKDRSGDEVYHNALHSSELADTLGQDVASKILGSADTSGSLSGQDLSVGGEGMKSYYDKIVPGVARDLIKKFGGQVGKSEIPTTTTDELTRRAGGGEYIVIPNNDGTFDIQDRQGTSVAENVPSMQEVRRITNMSFNIYQRSNIPVHSFDIPPALKNAAINGQSLFAVAPAAMAVAPQMPGESDEDYKRRQQIGMYGTGAALIAGHLSNPDPTLARLDEMLASDQRTSKYLQAGGFIERLQNDWKRAWTDNGIDLKNIEEGARKAAGLAGLPPDAQLAELRLLSPNPAAEVKIMNGLAPAIRSVGEDINNLSKYLILRHNLEIGNAIEEATKRDVLAQPLGAMPAKAQMQALQARQNMYQRFLAQANANGNTAAAANYTARIARTTRHINRANARLAMQTASAVAAQASKAAFEGKTAKMNRLYPGGITGEDENIQALQTLEQQLGPQRWQAIQQAANQVTNFGEQLLQSKVDSGIISQSYANELKRLYPEYVPTNIMDHMDSGPQPGMPKSRTLSLKDQGVRKLTMEGTPADQEDPLSAMIRRAYQTEAANFKNRTFNAIARIRQIDPAQAYIFKDVPDSYRAKPDEGIITGFILGNRVNYAVPKDLADTVQGANNTSMPAFARIMAIERGLMAASSPLFVPTHAAITALPYFINTLAAEGGNPLMLPKIALALFNGYRDAFSGGQDTQNYLKAGGGMFGTVFHSSPAGAKLALQDITRSNPLGRGYKNVPATGGIAPGATTAVRVTTKEQLGRIAKDVLTGKPIGEVINRVDLGPRVAAYNLAKARGLSETEAATVGRNVSVDFGKAGDWARTVNSFIPFFNVGIQGAVSPYRNFKKNPAAYAASLATIVGVPTIAAEAWNRSDPQRSKDYDDVPNYYKDRGWVIMHPGPAPVDSQGNRKPQFTFIPAREFAAAIDLTRVIANNVINGVPGTPYGGIAGTPLPTGGTIQRADNSRTWGSLLVGASENLLPAPVASYGAGLGRLIPGGPVVGTPIQELTNTNLGTGASIASKAADQRAGTIAKAGAGAINTVGNAVAQAMGNPPNFNARPSQVQFALQEMGGGYGELASSIGQEQGNAGNVPQYQPITGPIVSSLFERGSTGQQLANAREATMTPALRKVLAEGGITTVSPAAQEIKNMQLTQQEETELQTKMNAALDTWAKQLDAYPAFQRMPPAEKQKVLKARMAAVRQQVALQELHAIIQRDGVDAVKKRIAQSKAQKVSEINQELPSP